MLQGIRNACDTILWQLEASAFELKTVLDERTATQNALLKLDCQLDEFERVAEMDVGGDGGWGAGGGIGEGDDDEEEVVNELNE